MTSPRIALAQAISRDVLRAHADDVDRCNRFPHEGVQALREAGLVGLMLPAARGGPGGSLRELAGVAAAQGARLRDGGDEAGGLGEAPRGARRARRPSSAPLRGRPCSG